MSQQTVIKCDYCGIEKTNHLYKIDTCGVFIAVYTNENLNNERNYMKDACSHQCVRTAIEKFLNKTNSKDDFFKW